MCCVCVQPFVVTFPFDGLCGFTNLSLLLASVFGHAVARYALLTVASFLLWFCFLVAFTAIESSLLACLITHPADVVKTRLQIDKTHHLGTVETARRLLKVC